MASSKNPRPSRRGEDLPTSENPAESPTKPWSAHYADCVYDAWALIRRLGPQRRAVLAAMVKSPGSTHAAVELAGTAEATVEYVAETVTRVNKFSEALGHVPLVAISGAGYRIPRDAAVVVQSGLIEVNKRP